MTTTTFPIASDPAPRRPATRARRRIERVLLELAAPLTGAVFLALWVPTEIGRVGSAGPDFFIAAAAYALAIGLARTVPFASLTVWLLIPALGFAGIGIGAISETTWPMFALAPAIGALFISTVRHPLTRWLALGLGLAHALAIAVLMVRLENGDYANGWLGWAGRIPGNGVSLHYAAGHAVQLAIPMGGLLALCWLVGTALRLGANRLRELRRLREELVELRAVAAPTEAPPRAEIQATDSRMAQLTPREQEMLALVAKGLSNAEIARTAFISLPTVKTHLRSLMSKLEVRSRAQLVVLALDAGRAGELAN